MKQTKIIMGMPITVEIISKDNEVSNSIQEVFDYFVSVDKRFSTYKEDSEVTKLNNRLPRFKWSNQLKEVIELSEEAKYLTDGYFDININGKIDPSGLVKGWSIKKASNLIREKFDSFFIEAGGDIELSGFADNGQPWQVGIRNPFNIKQIVKTISLTKGGIATSGNYVRGNHIINPKTGTPVEDPVSLTVIGPDVYQADLYATAGFAMGLSGIGLIENTVGLEGYMINKDGIATKTTNFERYES